MEKEESNLYSRYQQDADAGKNGYYDYEWWLENKLTEAESELKKLRLADVSNSIATEYAEFCVRCDREKLPLLCLEDYIKQYCC